MPSYLVETFLPRVAAGDRRARDRATSSAAKALTRDGTPVRFGGSIYVPEDEICLYSFDAPSVGDVELVAERAGLRLLRVVVTLAVILLTGCSAGPGVSPRSPCGRSRRSITRAEGRLVDHAATGASDVLARDRRHLHRR